jgi:hypothetical protein
VSSGCLGHGFPFSLPLHASAHAFCALLRAVLLSEAEAPLLESLCETLAFDAVRCHNLSQVARANSLPHLHDAIQSALR